MPRWQRSAATVFAVAAVAGCSTTTNEPPQVTPSGATPAPVAEAPEALTAVTLGVPDGLNAGPLDEPRQALVPAGWSMSVWARIDKARFMAWTPDRALLVSVPATGDVVKLTPTPGGLPQQSILLEGLNAPHGLAFAGDTLYVAESDQVVTYRYADGKAGDRRAVAPGLPDARSPELKGAYSHALKSVAIGPDGTVYFSIGSTGNISAEDLDATPPRASIMRVPPGGGPAELFAKGVRNGTGLAIAPDGTVWTAVNNRDNVAVPEPGPDYGKVIPDYVDEHPPESIARLTPGRDLGWPWCNPDGKGANTPFIRDVETNPEGQRLDCATLPPIEQTVPAHSAPLGLSFVDGALPAPYARGALVGIHGSWNRDPAQAPEVSFYPWDGRTLGAQQTLVGGFQAPDGSRWGRPVAAVAGPDGAVYITDDYAGAVYRLAPPGR